MNAVAFRLAYHRPSPNTERIDLRSYGPIALFVETQDYLTIEDFTSARLLLHEGKPVVALGLTPGAREKFNHVAAINAEARQLEDYVQLIRCKDGALGDRLTLVNNHVAGFEIWINELTEPEAENIVASIGGPVAP